MPKWAPAVFGLGSGLIWFGYRWLEPLGPAHAALGASAATLIAWIYNHRRYRALADTPSTRIASAPQGYIELNGIGRTPQGLPEISPLTGLPCLWFRLLVERQNIDNEWVEETRQESESSFILEDESGQCIIDPEGAEIKVSACEQYTQGDTRTTLWLLIPGTRITALGEFFTRNHIVERESLNSEVRDLLADWKTSGEARRFDLNQDGQISQQEWELARAAARRTVSQARREAELDPQQSADMHCLRKPADGRPYLISDRPSAQITQRYRWYARGALLAAFVLAILGVWLSHTQAL